MERGGYIILFQLFFFILFSPKLTEWWIRGLCLLSNCLLYLMKKLNGNKSLWMCANRQKYNKFSVSESMLNYLQIMGWIAFKNIFPSFLFFFLLCFYDRFTKYSLINISFSTDLWKWQVNHNSEIWCKIFIDNLRPFK